jgi:hypothetical protein
MCCAAAVAVPVALGAMHPEVASKLRGSTEVPKGAPAGSGIVNVTLDGSKVCWTFEAIKGIDKPLAAHIHRAPLGKAGPIVVPLGGAYKAKGCTTSSKATVEAIESRPGAYYVNVHTKKYTAGAIRGQLVAGMVHA